MSKRNDLSHTHNKNFSFRICLATYGFWAFVAYLMSSLYFFWLALCSFLPSLYLSWASTSCLVFSYSSASLSLLGFYATLNCPWSSFGCRCLTALSLASLSISSSSLLTDRTLLLLARFYWSDLPRAASMAAFSSAFSSCIPVLNVWTTVSLPSESYS